MEPFSKKYTPLLETRGGPLGSDAIQKVYRFDNGFGASVVRHSFSYGNEQGQWELAVIKFNSDRDDEFDLTFGTDVSCDRLSVTGRG